MVSELTVSIYQLIGSFGNVKQKSDRLGKTSLGGCWDNQKCSGKEASDASKSEGGVDDLWTCLPKITNPATDHAAQELDQSI